MIQFDIVFGGGSGDDVYGFGSEVEFVHVFEGMLDIEVVGEGYWLVVGDLFMFDVGVVRRWLNVLFVYFVCVLWVIVFVLC